MSTIIHLLFLCTYAVVATALAAVLPDLAAIDAGEARSIGVVVFALAGLAHILRHGEQFHQRTEKALSASLDRHEVLDRKLDALKGEMIELEESMEAKAERKSAELVAELQVLQSLLAGMAAKTATKNRSAEDVLGQARAQADAQPVAPDDSQLLKVIENALEDNRLDLYIQPIVSLPQRKIRFLEVFSRVRNEVGQLIYPIDYLELAEKSGLIVTLDNLLLFRCIKLIRQLRETDGELSCFINVSCATIVDDKFFPQFVEFIESSTDLSGRLIFEFAQDDVAGAKPEFTKNLATLRGLGLRFSIDRTMRLDFDFTALADQGFNFVKIPASLLKEDPGPIKASDLKEAFDRNNIDLIVDKIENDRVLVDVLDHSVDYGQGFLFGEPQPSKLANPQISDVGAPQRATA